jgi:hypothetical protein
MNNIYEISELFKAIGSSIGAFLIENQCDEKFKRDLLNLSIQCSLSADKIIRDHADPGIALENCQIILRQFNELVLEYEKAY